VSVETGVKLLLVRAKIIVKKPFN